uniref:Probable serine/threonine-protein kinase dyrk1 n=2 Tax=Gouania willdenowi TaxID=441366 RepID=A0A8C5N9L9_GOUWI
MADQVISQLRVGSVLRSSTTEYTILEFIGEGSYGKVAKCQVGITSKLVAVKILKNRDSLEYELQMLTCINFLNSDKNVIKFYEHFYHLFCTCLVFELLEIDLFTFLIREQKKPMFVYEIRPIAKQMLVALQGLVSLEMMHADIKPDNIMLANIKECAYRVKLIDFGLAIRSSGARQGLLLQPIGYRAPEICLGLLYTESIDMWGLGCTLAFLYLTQNLFIVNCEYLMMKSMVEILGMPLAHELAFGMHSKRFFCQEDELGLRWRLLTPEEYLGINKIKAKEWPTGRPHYTSLDELFYDIKKEDAEEMKDIRMFIDFLKKMLHLDGWARITPVVALQHPFITMSHLSQDPDSSDYLTKAQEFMSKSELPLKDVVGQEDTDEERMAQLCPAAGQCEPTETDGSKHIFVCVQSLDSNSQWEDVETLEDGDEFEKVPFTPSSGQSEHIEKNVSKELHLHSTEDDSEIQSLPEQFLNSHDETLDLVSSVNGPAVDSSDYLTKAHEFMSKSELPLKDVVGQEDIDEERMAQLCPAAGQCEPTETDGSKHIFVGVQSLDSNSQWEDVETLEDEDEFEKVPFTPSSGQSEHIERNVSKELHLHSTEDDSEIQFLPEQFFSSRDETLDLVSSVNGPVVEDVPRPTPTPKRFRKV